MSRVVLGVSCLFFAVCVRLRTNVQECTDPPVEAFAVYMTSLLRHEEEQLLREAVGDFDACGYGFEQVRALCRTVGGYAPPASLPSSAEIQALESFADHCRHPAAPSTPPRGAPVPLPATTLAGADVGLGALAAVEGLSPLNASARPLISGLGVGGGEHDGAAGKVAAAHEVLFERKVTAAEPMPALDGASAAAAAAAAAVDATNMAAAPAWSAVVGAVGAAERKAPPASLAARLVAAADRAEVEAAKTKPSTASPVLLPEEPPASPLPSATSASPAILPSPAFSTQSLRTAANEVFLEEWKTHESAPAGARGESSASLAPPDDPVPATPAVDSRKLKVYSHAPSRPKPSEAGAFSLDSFSQILRIIEDDSLSGVEKQLRLERAALERKAITSARCAETVQKQTGLPTGLAKVLYHLLPPVTEAMARLLKGEAPHASLAPGLGVECMPFLRLFRPSELATVALQETLLATCEELPSTRASARRAAGGGGDAVSLLGGGDALRVTHTQLVHRIGHELEAHNYWGVIKEFVGVTGASSGRPLDRVGDEKVDKARNAIGLQYGDRWTPKRPSLPAHVTRRWREDRASGELVEARNELDYAHARMMKKWGGVLPDVPRWSDDTVSQVGLVLLEAVLATATIRDSASLGVAFGEKESNDGFQYAPTVPAFSMTLCEAMDKDRPGASYKTRRELVAAQQVRKALGLRDTVTEQRSVRAEALAARLSKDVSLLPMLVPPQPWTSTKMGGYLWHRQPCVRFHGSRTQKEMLERHRHSLGPFLSALSGLGATPWFINEAVLNVAVQLWNEGEGDGKLKLPGMDDVELPTAALFGADADEDAGGGDGDGAGDGWRADGGMGQLEADAMRARQQLEKERAAARKVNNEAHSLRMSMQYVLATAQALVGRKFYMPYSVDFRGRAYAVPAMLAPTGGDLQRALLQFADARPLGERGLFWLHVQVANLHGNNKLSLEERVAFTQEHMREVADAALRPIDGGGWWRQAEDPWQCLAACTELHAALSSPDPEAYRSRLTVHQDGSCNGLQHYAALGGDVEGGAAVNLVPADRPQDVYSEVLAEVNKLVAADAAEGDREALLLDGAITRKVVKQTVMTYTYGVTFVGARDQIAKQLRNAQIVDDDDVGPCAKYLARKVFLSIGSMFAGAEAIQSWLKESARMIAHSGQPVAWVTPLGLPVVQPYHHGVAVHTKGLRRPVQLLRKNDPRSPVNPAKQAGGFPPNFIHSLDATHMFFTADECRRRGVTFAAVHDSYWTHAGSVDTMNEVLRDQFVKLYSQPIMRNLRDQFATHYQRQRHKIRVSRATSDAAPPAGAGTEEEAASAAATDDTKKAAKGGRKTKAGRKTPEWRKVVEFPEVPTRGSLDLNQVRKSPYFFS